MLADLKIDQIIILPMPYVMLLYMDYI